MFGCVVLSLAGFVYGLRENGNGGARQREAAPGAGIPMPYRVVSWVAVAWMLLAFAVGAWLRSRRRQAWEEMGAVFG